MTTQNRGVSLKAIDSLDFSGGVQTKTTPALASQKTLLHLLNADIDKKLGALVGRCGSTVKNSTAKVIVSMKVFWNGTAKKYIVVASDGANEVVYTVPNSDFSGTLTAIRAGDFANSVNVHSETFAKKEFFFNGISAPVSYDGTSFATVTNAPTKGKFPQVYNQRLYVFSTDGFLHYSDVINATGDDFSSTEWTNRGINPNDGQIPKGMKRHRGRLVLFKTESIYRFNGSNEPEPIINVGTHSERAIVQTDLHIFFHHRFDIYKMSLGDPVSISRPVEKYLRGMDTANWDKVAGGQDGKYAYFWIGNVTINDPLEWDNGKVYSNVVLAYNLLLDRWTVFTGWDARLWYINPDDGKLYFATNSGDITLVDPTVYSDNGAPIDFQAMWHPISYGYPQYRKTVDRIMVSGTQSLQVRAGDDASKMDKAGSLRENGCVEIRASIDFYKLWIAVSQSYKNTPPMVEQISIGSGDMRNN